MKKASDSLRVASLLSFIGGFLEIYSFLLKGKVFATAITGNMVLMFYNIANSNFSKAARYLLPIIFFCIGVILAYKLNEKIKNFNIHFREIVILIEIILVILIYILRKEEHVVATICLISTMSALQFQSFKSIRGNTYISTMFTGNTRRLIEFLLEKNYSKAKMYMLIIFCFGLGVMIGGIFIEYLKEISILILLIPLTIVYYIIKKYEGKL